MAKRNCAAVDVQRLVRNTELAHAGNGLACKGFVQFHNTEIFHLQSRARKRFAGCRNGSDAHELRGASGNGRGANARKRLESLALGVAFAADEYRGGSVREGGRCSRSHRSILVECGLQFCKALQRGIRTNAAVKLYSAVLGWNRNDFGRKLSCLLCLCRPHMAAESESLLLGTGNFPFARNVFRG